MIATIEQMNEFAEPKFKVREKLMTIFQKEMNPEVFPKFKSMVHDANQMMNDCWEAMETHMGTMMLSVVVDDHASFAAFFVAGAEEEFLQKVAKAQGKRFFIPDAWKPAID
jgi:hypothetical protein